MNRSDTIVALATAPGRGGVAIIRASGPLVSHISQAVLGALPQARYAHYTTFRDHDGSIIDLGIALFFPAPHSFTGEDVLELHGHGGIIVMDCLLRRLLSLGARLAQPGEFSQRAFLNNRLDLTQAEAIADLIDSSSEQAARCALRSLQGEFSQYINHLIEALIQLRMFVEAAIDFPEEEVDFLSDGAIEKQLITIIQQLMHILQITQQGVLLREGIQVVIAGRPNAGKSSLLNALSGYEAAIVTPVPGTTRDLLREHIQINGIPLHIIDTAGLRESTDIIEQEGIRRALLEIEKADRILFISDATDLHNIDEEINHFPLLAQARATQRLSVIHNKIDLTGMAPSINLQQDIPIIHLSAKTQQGLDLLRQHLLECMHYIPSQEGSFTARRRHVDALEKAHAILVNAHQQFHRQRTGELLAEDLRIAQQSLAEITGAFTADDLLGRIFSSFCIGK